MKKTLFSLLTTAMLLTSANVNAQTLSVETVEIEKGGQTELVVNLAEGTAMTALQFKLQLPEGLTADAGSVTLGAATNGHTLSVQPLASGDLLFVLYSMDLKAFNNGELLRIPLSASNEALADLGQLYTVRTATAEAVSHACSNETFNIDPYLLGDINGDDKVDVTDYIGVANIILTGTPSASSRTTTARKR